MSRVSGGNFIISSRVNGRRSRSGICVGIVASGPGLPAGVTVTAGFAVAGCDCSLFLVQAVEM